ncbi:MAG: glycerophosphodiester phosphodiesterase [Fusobacteriales bacterium]|nr:glycerophosphodiester phosphodiesterase [Fusobacteriales bacterium]
MKKIGHRGVRGIKPENTLESIAEAVNLKFDMVEIDVQMTKDGEIIVFHDYNLKRLFNSNKKISELTYEELLTITDKIPLLKEVIKNIKDKNTELNIEIKELFQKNGIIEELIYLLERYSFKEKVLISSFDHVILKEIKKRDETLKTAVLVASRPADPISVIKAAEADGYNSLYYFMDKEIISECHKYGYFVNIWTVNTKAEAEYYKNMGVDGIISDYNLF